MTTSYDYYGEDIFLSGEVTFVLEDNGESDNITSSFCVKTDGAGNPSLGHGSESNPVLMVRARDTRNDILYMFGDDYVQIQTAYKRKESIDSHSDIVGINMIMIIVLKLLHILVF